MIRDPFKSRSLVDVLAGPTSRSASGPAACASGRQAVHDFVNGSTCSGDAPAQGGDAPPRPAAQLPNLAAPVGPGPARTDAIRDPFKSESLADVLAGPLSCSASGPVFFDSGLQFDHDFVNGLTFVGDTRAEGG